MAKDPNNLVLIHFVMIIHNQTKSINTLKNIINNPSKNNNSKRKDDGRTKKDELPFLFCDQPLPNPLPKKLLEYLKTLRRKKKILETDRGDFCFMHHAELKIVPLGSCDELRPGYYGPKGPFD
ncbi:unnamed protein product [Rhizophagus irregularis]|nr:unnamed protein product [Rhizophagus irregularis]